MAINATNNGTARILIPAGNYVARCYQMIHIGTIEDSYQGEKKIMNKVRIGWELPTELRVFKEERGEEPPVISQEFTLSMNEKANLRKLLASWRGKDFSDKEANSFDISVLVGKPCMLNIIHKTSKDGSKVYEHIGSISPMPKGMGCPPPILDTEILQYDAFDNDLFEKLPDFLKNKIRSSAEYMAMKQPTETHIAHDDINSEDDDLPF